MKYTKWISYKDPSAAGPMPWVQGKGAFMRVTTYNMAI